MISAAVIFDIVPMIIAGYAIFALASSRTNTETIIARMCAVLLIICQSTWIHSYLNNFKIVESFADSLWTLFNTVAMILAIIVAHRNR